MAGLRGFLSSRVVWLAYLIVGVFGMVYGRSLAQVLTVGILCLVLLSVSVICAEREFRRQVRKGEEVGRLGSGSGSAAMKPFSLESGLNTTEKERELSNSVYVSEPVQSESEASSCEEESTEKSQEWEW
jgi:hypothetical protein